MPKDFFMVYSLNGKTPRIHPGAFTAPSADLIGDVTLEDNAGVWFQAVLRGDDAAIIIGKNSNIQDGVVIHGEKDTPVIIEENVTVGHRAVIHASVIGQGSLIGMGAVILSGCRIAQNCLIAAGTLLPEKTVIPPYSVVMGNPGKVVKNLSEKLAERLQRGSSHYVEMNKFYKKYCQIISSNPK